MKTALPPNPSFDEAKQWILTNIEGCIIPDATNLHLVPKIKGIYFWLIKPEIYAELNRFVSIQAIQPIVEKDGRHLVYLGTAGTGKGGGGHLNQRLTWHITQAHTQSAICSGTISTFRAGLGSLLSGDLILCPPSNTEKSVNELLKKYFQVCWITMEDESKIDDYEKTLIQRIRPLFNIKLNPNARIVNQVTKLYKNRRASILRSTQLRLGCSSKGLSSKSSMGQLIPPVGASPKSGNYYVSFNIPNKNVTIHVGECGHCNYGRGKIKRIHGDRNGAWLGPFLNYQKAKVQADDKALLLETASKDCRCI